MPKQRRSIYTAKRVRREQTCRRCGAQPGGKCWENDRTIDGCHRERHIDYERKMGKAPKRGQKGLEVRYVCPVCGGSHARADHPTDARGADSAA